MQIFLSWYDCENMSSLFQSDMFSSITPYYINIYSPNRNNFIFIYQIYIKIIIKLNILVYYLI